MRASIISMSCITLAILLMAVTCENKEASGPIAIETLKKGHAAFNTNGEAVRIALRSKSEWQKFWKDNLDDPGKVVPEIDFKESTVIAMIMDRKPSGGFAIEMKNIIEEKDQIMVAFEETIPGPLSPVTLAETQPYHVVVIPRTDKSVVFKKLTGQIEFETLKKGAVAYSASSVQDALRSEALWAKFWQSNMSGQSESVPDVDFENNMVIAVIDEEHNSGGYDINIIQILESHEDIKVYVQYKSPAPTDMVTMAMTRPYHYIMTKTSNKKVEFIVIK